MSLISPNFDVKSITFPNFGQGPFPKIAGKSPAFFPVCLGLYGRQVVLEILEHIPYLIFWLK